MKKIKEISKYIIIIAIIAALLYFATKLLEPKYMTNIKEGAMTAEYYLNAGDNQVIFLGDCEVYENFSPVTLWEEYGITSYIRGNANQLIWQSYYLLEETLKYETPRVVIYNVQAMRYSEPVRESYNRMALDGMKLSPIKLKAIKDSMMEDENMITYIFTILRYHSRWMELSGEDLKYWLKRDRVTNNGYLMKTGIMPVQGLDDYYNNNHNKELTYDELYNIGFIKPAPYNTTMAFTENVYEYLNKMLKLCKDNNIEFVLIKSPSIYPYWYEQWDKEIKEYAQKNDICYINMLECFKDIKIDYRTDTYDGGLHLNLYGAEKASVWIGKYLKEKFNLDDLRNNTSISDRWQEKIKIYYNMIINQVKEQKEQD